MDRIKRLSYEVLDAYKSKFGEDFADNKKALDQISIIRSKGLKNEVAGYITKFIKKEIREEQEKQSQISVTKVEETIEEKVPRPEAQQETVPEPSSGTPGEEKVPRPEAQQETVPEPSSGTPGEEKVPRPEAQQETVPEPTPKVTKEDPVKTIIEPAIETDAKENSKEKSE